MYDEATVAEAAIGWRISDGRRVARARRSSFASSRYSCLFSLSLCTPPVQ